jgi:hypothetical protein
VSVVLISRARTGHVTISFFNLTGQRSHAFIFQHFFKQIGRDGLEVLEAFSFIVEKD